MPTKLCTKCGVELILGETITEGQLRGRNYICRICNSEKGKIWSKANRERMNATAQKRLRADPEALKAYRHEYYSRNKDKWREYHRSWREIRRLDPAKRATLIVTWTRTRAHAMGLEFDLTPEFIFEKLNAGICEATGLPFVFTDGIHGKKKIDPYAPSLDRMDPSKGYIQSNVRIVAYIYNLTKSEFSDEVVIKFARQVVERADAK